MMADPVSLVAVWVAVGEEEALVAQAVTAETEQSELVAAGLTAGEVP